MTFAEEGSRFKESQPGLVEAEVGAIPGFAGFAIHHYGS